MPFSLSCSIIINICKHDQSLQSCSDVYPMLYICCCLGVNGGYESDTMAVLSRCKNSCFLSSSSSSDIIAWKRSVMINKTAYYKLGSELPVCWVQCQHVCVCVCTCICVSIYTNGCICIASDSFKQTLPNVHISPTPNKDNRIKTDGY